MTRLSAAVATTRSSGAEGMTRWWATAEPTASSRATRRIRRLPTRRLTTAATPWLRSTLRRRSERGEYPGPVARLVAGGGRGATAPANGTLVVQSVALTDVVSNEQLSHFMDAGDVTGDGAEDYLAWGTQNFYLVPGPLNPEDQLPVDVSPILLGSIAAYGTPISQFGDIDGGGVNDLVFVRHANGEYTFTTIAGGSGLGQGSLASAAITNLSDAAIGASASFALVNWDGVGRYPASRPPASWRRPVPAAVTSTPRPICSPGPRSPRSRTRRPRRGASARASPSPTWAIRDSRDTTTLSSPTPRRARPTSSTAGRPR